jgi:hypothetical protein
VKAALQGSEANIEYFSKVRVTECSDPRFRPLIRDVAGMLRRIWLHPYEAKPHACDLRLLLLLLLPLLLLLLLLMLMLLLLCLLHPWLHRHHALFKLFFLHTHRRMLLLHCLLKIFCRPRLRLHPQKILQQQLRLHPNVCGRLHLRLHPRHGELLHLWPHWRNLLGTQPVNALSALVSHPTHSKLWVHWATTRNLLRDIATLPHDRLTPFIDGLEARTQRGHL